jgi:hypothetical protein
MYNFIVEILHALNNETVFANSVTSALIKDHDTAIKGKFLPSSYQNDGKRHIFGSECKL